MNKKNETVWETLSSIDVSKNIEKKNGFSYLSWAWAWTTLKQHYPDATFHKHISPVTELPFFVDGETGNAFVVVTVRAGEQSATEVYPVLNHANKPIAGPSNFDVNNALQRGMVKAMAYLGLGCYIYAGEDLPAGPRAAEVEGKEVKGVELIAKALVEFLPMQKTVEDLEGFWKRNKEPVGILKAEDQRLYEGVLAKFKARKAELDEEGKTNG